jgi:hypothetical protein
MIPDPNEEIREIKRKLSAQFDNDVHRIAEETRRRQRESDRKVITLPPRAPIAIKPKSVPIPASDEATHVDGGDSSVSAP